MKEQLNVKKDHKTAMFLTGNIKEECNVFISKGPRQECPTLIRMFAPKTFPKSDFFKTFAAVRQ